MYQITVWVDETDQYENRYTEVDNSDGTITHNKVRGTVYVEGTPQDAAHFNNMEGGILDAHTAVSLLVNAIRQQGWRVEALETATATETDSKTLTNTQAFPFNNSIQSVALANRRDNTDYVVEILSVVANGNPGEIEITERQVNGFKISYTGSASSVTVTYTVIGGYDQ